MRQLLPAIAACTLIGGCTAFPDVVHEPQFHNPFPQLSRIAVLPFFNQSADPTIDQDQIAIYYYEELQQIPGFEVMPVGVAKRLAVASGIEPHSGEDFQRLARLLGVDAVVVGSVTQHSPYYPPRLGLAVRWYAANPGFHPIPPGYGLPWGTAEEEFIPESLVFEAEMALARKQLETQTPEYIEEVEQGDGATSPELPAHELPNQLRGGVEHAWVEELPAPELGHGASQSDQPTGPAESIAAPQPDPPPPPPLQLPSDWPDPRGFVPPSPSTERPELIAQPEPVLSLTRLYNGNDSAFTTRLANYYYFRDEARFGGWQAYLERSDDFIRFCCYLHISEMLAARGGVGKSRVVLRWPIDRYER